MGEDEAAFQQAELHQSGIGAYEARRDVQPAERGQAGDQSGDDQREAEGAVTVDPEATREDHFEAEQGAQTETSDRHDAGGAAGRQPPDRLGGEGTDKSGAGGRRHGDTARCIRGAWPGSPPLSLSPASIRARERNTNIAAVAGASRSSKHSHNQRAIWRVSRMRRCSLLAGESKGSRANVFNHRQAGSNTR